MVVEDFNKKGRKEESMYLIQKNYVVQFNEKLGCKKKLEQMVSTTDISPRNLSFIPHTGKQIKLNSGKLRR